MTKHLNATEVRGNFAKIMDRISKKGERVVLVRRGRNVAALVPVEVLDLVEKIEDHADLEEAREALAEAREKGTIPWKKLKADLGL
jgi:prevent-host-death family protein